MEINNKNTGLSVIVFTDLWNFSKSTEQNEELTLQKLNTQHEIVETLAETFSGVIKKNTGDGYLIVFSSVIKALDWSIKVQQKLHEFNSKQKDDDQIWMRIGIHIGEIFFTESDVFGHNVNVASRIEGKGVPGQIYVSELVYKQLSSRKDIDFKYQGSYDLKNISQPIKLYEVVSPEVPTTRPKGFKERNPIFERRRKLVIQMIIAAGITIFISWGIYIQFFTTPENNTKIVILPLRADSGVTTPYLSYTLTQQLIDYFSHTSFQVIAYESAAYYLEHNVTTSQIFNDAKVEYIVSGELWESGTSIEAAVRIQNSTKKDYIWEGKFIVPAIESEHLGRMIFASVSQKLGMKDQSIVETKVSPAFDEYAKGNVLLGKRNKPDTFIAIEFFKRSIQLDSIFIPSIYALADAYHTIDYNEWDRSKDYLSLSEGLCWKIIGVDSSFSKAYSLLGAIYLQRDRFEDGVILLNKSLRLNKNDVLAHTMLGEEFAFRRNEPTEALSHFITASEIQPNDETTIANLAIGFGMMRSYQESKQYFERALRLNSSNAWTWNQYAILQEKIGMIDSAQISFRHALELDDSYADPRISIASHLIIFNMLTHCDSLLQIGIAMNPNEIDFYYYRGIVKEQQGDRHAATEQWKKGLFHIENLLGKDHENGSLLIKKSLFHSRLGNSREAMFYGSEANRIAPNSDEILLGLTRMYANMDNKDSMLVYLKRAKQISSDIDESYIATSVELHKYKNDDAVIQLIIKN